MTILSCRALTSALLAAAASTATPAALAQGLPETTERDVIVVTGTALPANIAEIGNAVTILDGFETSPLRFTYLSDVLRRVPGAAVAQSGSFGSLGEFRLRGGEANHTLFLIDGVDITSPATGGVDISTLVTGNTARVEVVRGPQSGLYGANALSGVVNILSAPSPVRPAVGLQLEAGSYQSRRLVADTAVGGENWYVASSGVFIDTDGFDSSIAGAVPETIAFDGDADGNEVGSLFLRAGVAPTEDLRASGFIRFLDKETESDGYNGPLGAFSDDGSVERTDDFNGALSLGADVFGDRLLLGGTVSRTTAEFRTRGSGTYGTRTGVRTQASAPVTRGETDLTLTSFAEYERETFRNLTPFDPSQGEEQDREIYGFGGAVDIGLRDRLFLSGNVRRDENDAFEDATTWGASAAFLLPDLPLPLRLHASGGRAIVNPTFYEQFGFIPGSFLGNPDLEPENALGYDVGIGAQLPGDRGEIDVTYFSSTLKDEIQTVFGPVVTTAINADEESERSGVEVSADLTPVRGLTIAAQYAYIDATGPQGDVEQRRPEHSATFDILYTLPGDRFGVSAGVVHNGERRDIDAATFAPVTLDGYITVQTMVTMQVTPKLLAYVRGENVLDEEFQPIAGYNGAEASVYGGVRIGLFE